MNEVARMESERIRSFKLGHWDWRLLGEFYGAPTIVQITASY
jgi:hypothetical protein